MGEMIVMIAAALLLVPVIALVLAIVALVRLGRLEKRLAAFRGGVENVPAPAGTPRLRRGERNRHPEFAA